MKPTHTLASLLGGATLLMAAAVNAATFTVTSTEDALDAVPGDGACETATGTCTLRAAIQEANALSGADIIDVPAGTFLLTIAGRDENASATGDLDILSDITLRGAGPGITVIDAGGIDRVFHVRSTGTAVIDGVTIRGGLADDAVTFLGGGIQNEGTLSIFRSVVRDNTANGGGGIRNSGTLTIEESTLTGNRAESFGFTAAKGGALEGTGVVVINQSTLFGNFTSFGATVDIINNVSIDIVSSTISGNSGIFSIRLQHSDASISHSTITGNFGSIAIAASAHNEFFPSTVTFSHTIVGDNAGSECAFSGTHLTVVSEGDNISSDGSCPFSGAGDLINTDPQLGPLQANGGLTFTHALLAGSPAIDAGNNADCPATDQRGFARVADGDLNSLATCDIGAYEAGISFVVNFFGDSVDANPGDGVCTILPPASFCSLRAAIMESNARVGADTIVVLPGVYNLTIAGQFENLSATGDLDITDDTILTGAGANADSTIIDGNSLDGVIDVRPGATAVIRNLTVIDGFSPFAVGEGSAGGIRNRGPLVLLENVSVTRNRADFGGGGVSNCGSCALHLLSSRVSLNETGTNGSGGGIQNSGALLIENSTVSNNVGLNGGGIANSGDMGIIASVVDGNEASDLKAAGPGVVSRGGGISNVNASMSLTNSTISENTTDGSGGGVYTANPGLVNLLNVTIANNTADRDGNFIGQGGGINNPSGLTLVELKNTLIAGNIQNTFPQDCDGLLTSRGFNLIQTASGVCPIDGDTTGNLLGIDPLIGPLADNGGPTLTHALLAGSPAIDGGDNGGCPAADQRGTARPKDGDSDGTATCDIGAFEEIDLDGDGVPDAADNCPLHFNPDQSDNEPDGIGDVCDPDDDNDGMPDAFENANGLDPRNAADAALDADGDGLTNLEEFNLGTGINNPDSDGDGISDGDEFLAGRNPLVNEGAVITIINSILLGDD